MTRETSEDNVRRDSASSYERASPPSTLLITQPSTTEVGQDACIDAITVHPPSTANLMVITNEQSPDEWLATWRERIGDSPANLALIAVGSTTRSASQPTPTPPEVTAGKRQVLSVADPGDLTQLGITVSKCLTEWRANPNRTVVCGGSLTAMLQWVELEVLFRFLHVFLQRLRAADALVHFHLHPAAHADQTRQTLEPLFDFVIDEPLNRSRLAQSDVLDTDAIHELSEPTRRRHILRILLDEDAMAIGDLIDRVVAREHTKAPDAISERTRERMEIDLRHNHLAKLETAGLIEYDEIQNSAQLAVNESRVRSYLERIDE